MGTSNYAQGVRGVKYDVFTLVQTRAVARNLPKCVISQLTQVVRPQGGEIGVHFVKLGIALRVSLYNI